MRVALANIVGAPGDGGASLGAAMRDELSSTGFTVEDGTVTGTHRIESTVTLGADKNGSQPIQIEWIVKGPDGKKLGTVSQKNDIPTGALDGPWGKVAEQAAGAAVQGLLKLLPVADSQPPAP